MTSTSCRPPPARMQWGSPHQQCAGRGPLRTVQARPITCRCRKPSRARHYELLLRMRDEAGKESWGPDKIHDGRRALRHHAEHRSLGHRKRLPLAGIRGRWKARKNSPMCSINLSGQSLGDDKFLPYVIDQFHRSGLGMATKICFENHGKPRAIASFSQANRFIQALKELGCKFALDDFGTGLSSFGYLKHFPGPII